jgi:hypothetical protein
MHTHTQTHNTHTHVPMHAHTFTHIYITRTHAQSITVTFSPPDNKEHRQLVVFGCSKGRPVALELVGVGSYDEVEEHQRVLYQI